MEQSCSSHYIPIRRSLNIIARDFTRLVIFSNLQYGGFSLVDACLVKEGPLSMVRQRSGRDHAKKVIHSHYLVQIPGAYRGRNKGRRNDAFFVLRGAGHVECCQG